MTLDMFDRFVMHLMNDFYESLKDDLSRYAERLVEAVKAEKQTDIDLYSFMMSQIRETIKDMGNENMEIKDFVHLLAEKYGLKIEAKNG